MKEKQFGIITFKSVNHAMKAESIFKGEDIEFRTIPTPREITHSCGIAVRFNLKDTEMAKNIIDANKIEIIGIFKLTKNKDGSVAEKIC